DDDAQLVGGPGDAFVVPGELVAQAYVRLIGRERHTGENEEGARGQLQESGEQGFHSILHNENEQAPSQCERVFARTNKPFNWSRSGRSVMDAESNRRPESQQKCPRERTR